MDAPHLRDEHMTVFDTAMGERSIHYMGHIRMMGAVQPFISGAISKTVNLPENVTVEDVEQVYIEGWRLGLKALALYRDNCKVAQPLSTAKKEKAEAPVERDRRARSPQTAEGTSLDDLQVPCRRHRGLPHRPASSPRVASARSSCRVAKQGSTLAGIMDAFAISISMGLQYGVPLSAYVKQFANTRFEPSGMTDDPDFRMATSILDYVFRRLAAQYLPPEERHALGIRTAGERQGEIESKLDAGLDETARRTGTATGTATATGMPRTKA